MANFRVTYRLVEQKRPQEIVGKLIREGHDWFGIVRASGARLGPFPRQLPAAEAVYARFLQEADEEFDTHVSKPAPPPQRKLQPKQSPPPEPVILPEPVPQQMSVPPQPKRKPKAPRSGPAPDFAGLLRLLDKTFKKLPTTHEGGMLIERERREHASSIPEVAYGVDHGKIEYGKHWVAFGVTDGELQVEYLLTGHIPREEKSYGGQVATAMHVAAVMLPMLAVAKHAMNLDIKTSRDTVELRFEGDVTGVLAGAQDVRSWGGPNFARHLVFQVLG